MEFKNVSDCWKTLRSCYDLSELIYTTQDFPNWSGDWTVELVDQDTVRVTNRYFEDITMETEEEAEDFDVKLTRDGILELLEDSIEIDIPDFGCSVIIKDSDSDKLLSLVKQSVDLYNSNPEQSSFEYFKELIDNNDLKLFFDFEYNN